MECERKRILLSASKATFRIFSLRTDVLEEGDVDAKGKLYTLLGH